MAFTASYTAVWTMARWMTDVGGGWPRPGGSAVPGLLIAATAFAFQRGTMSFGVAAEVVADGMIAAMARVAVIKTARQRFDDVVIDDMTDLSSLSCGRT